MDAKTELGNLLTAFEATADRNEKARLIREMRMLAEKECARLSDG